MDDTMKSDLKTPGRSGGPVVQPLPQPVGATIDDPPVADQPMADGKVSPIMATLEDAEACAVREKDAFYLAAFFIQAWLSGLLELAAAQYAENKNPRERCMQTGQAWQGFLDLFGSILAKGHGYLLSCLLRFSRSIDAPGNSLRTALVPLSIEHDCTGDFFGPRTFEAAREPQKFNELARRTIIRWCDWLDAAVHLQAHRRAHLAPACFAPDPETRWLGALGYAERNLASLSGCAQLAWFADFVSAAANYRESPKRLVVDEMTSNAPNKVWLHVDVDVLVIALWPLVTAYDWTYRDLLHVLRPALKLRPDASANSAFSAFERNDSPIHRDTSHSALHRTYPCQREQDLAIYCANVLGLRKNGKGVNSKNGHPAGYDIALRYCPSLAGNISH